MTGTRLQSVDVYRGLAIVAMAAYHTIWDLNYYRLIEVGIGFDPLWLSIQRAILTAFMLLAGAGIALAHGDGIRWRSFWRREIILVAAAGAVSLGTYLLFGPALAWFGVLHAIALFSLLALPFLAAPLWLGGIIAAAVLLLPLYGTTLFDAPWLAWIGFFINPPETADLVPVFPWFGVLLIGLLGMRRLRNAPAFLWSSRHPGVRMLALLGRWSLVIYLVHQPLIFGIVTPIANWLDQREQVKLEGFLQSCRKTCDPQNGAEFCTAYCTCTLEMTVRDNLWDAIDARPRTEAQQSSVNQLTALCTALNN